MMLVRSQQEDYLDDDVGSIPASMKEEEVKKKKEKK